LGVRLRVESRGFRVQGSGFRVQGSRFRIQDLGFRGRGLGFRVQDSGFRFQVSGFRVQNFRLKGLKGFFVRLIADIRLILKLVSPPRTSMHSEIQSVPWFQD